MNYLMIGADGRQYGPATELQMGDWMAQGRVNAQTLVQPEGTTDWKPVAQVPELAALLAATAVPPRVRSLDARKSKLAAGLLGVFLGWVGVHRFYLGYTTIGVAQILVTFFTCGYGAIWGFIEGILILCGAALTTDADGQLLRDP